MKRFLLFLALGAVFSFFLYVSYEWFCEWFGGSSKFGFAFDDYTVFGLLTILFLLLVMAVILKLLFSGFFGGKILNDGATSVVCLSGVAIFMTCISEMNGIILGSSIFIFFVSIFLRKI
jgi:hypothetical protein